MYTKEITVFTPTFNRSYIIKNVYDSLLRQSYKDFEWLVIDDGSTDNTEDLIGNFILEGKLDITYIKKNNGGKHTALNMAVEKAKGRILMSVDSDDYLIDQALERIMYWERTIADKDDYAGVSGLRIFPSGKVIGTEWSHNTEYIDATNLERKKYKLMGDKAEAYYTDVLKKFYPIPVFEGENFVSEGVLWNRVANGGYKIRWFNEGIYITEYLDDGLTKNAQIKIMDNFKGYICWRKELIDMQNTYFGVIREASEVTKMARLKGFHVSQISKLLNRNLFTIWFAEGYYVMHVLKGIIIKYKGRKQFG